MHGQKNIKLQSTVQHSTSVVSPSPRYSGHRTMCPKVVTKNNFASDVRAGLHEASREARQVNK